ncbi:MAG: hypothetical protein GY696_08270 [Gammaproteobacteria bacterium]|nr:hypothetical protein [Gammaproteobacteria bacterium]
MLVALGFCISWPKIVSPVQKAPFLGLWLDSCTMQISLPPEKVDILRAKFLHLRQATSVSKKELQSLCGLANFAAKVVRGARTFSRRLIDASNSLRLPYNKTKISSSMKLDIEWWLRFMSVFNGTNVIISSSLRPIIRLETDSSTLGFGAVCAGDWIAGNWIGSPSPKALPFLLATGKWSSSVDLPPSNLDRRINYLELLAILLSARRWGPYWRDCRVRVFSDNTQAVANINRGVAKNPLSMALLRELFWISVQNNFHITTCHIPGADNPLPDALSRLSDDKFLSKFLRLNNSLLCFSSLEEFGSPILSIYGERDSREFAKNEETPVATVF